MRIIGSIVTVLLGLAFFGLPILRCFMGILVMVLGVGVEAAMTIGLFLTVLLIVGIVWKNN
jgi:hypothetical protein